MTGLDVSDDILRASVAKAIIEALSVEKRDLLLTNALKSILTPVKKGYGTEEKSILEVTFEQELQSYVRQFIKTELEKVGSPLKAKMIEVLEAGITKWITGRTDKASFFDNAVDNVAGALSKAFTRDY